MARASSASPSPLLRSPGLTLVLAGPRFAGKTTLGLVLARTLAWTYHGGLFAELTTLDDASDEPQGPKNLGLRVVAAEVRRDNTWSERREEGGWAPRIVESWHPGNAAYVTLVHRDRASVVVPALLDIVAGEPDPVVQPLDASDDALLVRLRRAGRPPEHLATIREHQAQERELIEGWGLPVLPTVDTSQATVSESLSHVVAHLAAAGHLAAAAA